MSPPLPHFRRRRGHGDWLSAVEGDQLHRSFINFYSLNCSAYKSASFMAKQRRTGRSANRLISLPFFHDTIRSISSPMISGQSAKAKPGMGVPSAS